MDNKTYVENKKKELNILETSLWMYKFSYNKKYDEKIKSIEAAIENIKNELYNNQNLMDV